MLVNTEKKYTSPSGKVVQPKKLGPSCKGCRFKCDQNFTRDRRQALFDTFYEFDAEAQRGYLLSLRSIVPSTLSHDQQRNRALNYAFHVDGHRVCHKWMTETFAIGCRRLREVKKDDNRGE